MVGVFPGPKFDDAEGVGVSSKDAGVPSVKQMRSPHTCQNFFKTPSRKVTPFCISLQRKLLGLILWKLFWELVGNVWKC